MTPHEHREYVPGCFRCELSRDEVTAAAIAVPVCFQEGADGFEWFEPACQRGSETHVAFPTALAAALLSLETAAREVDRVLPTGSMLMGVKDALAAIDTARGQAS